MYDFDCDIYKYTTDHGLVYTRYSDDILISSDKEIDKNDMTRIISDILSKKKGLNFKINNKKTKIITMIMMMKVVFLRFISRMILYPVTWQCFLPEPV